MNWAYKKHFCSLKCFYWRDTRNCIQCNTEFPKKNWRQWFCDSLCKKMSDVYIMEDFRNNLPINKEAWYRYCLANGGTVVRHEW